eukprot:4289512-Amphidinium_carterae.3
MQQVEAKNARLRADGFGALPQLIQALQTQTRDKLPSLVDTKGVGVKFVSFVVGVYGEETRSVFTWASEQESDITDRDVLDQFGPAADTVGPVHEIPESTLCVATAAHVT